MRFKILVLIVMTGAALSPSARAQNTPVIVVHPLPLHIIDKNADALWRIPGNTSLAETKQMPERRAVTIKDLTDYIPSVYAQPRNGAESSRLSVRGSGLANTFQGRGLLVMQDGVPITMTDGEFEFPVIDPWLVDYVRALPGANALAEGASTLGGALDFITPQNVESGALRTEAGSFGTVHGFASYGHDGIFASASDFRQNGYRENNDQNIARLNVQGEWQKTPDFAQRIFVSHTRSRAEIPGAISTSELRADPTQANPANVTNHYQRDLDITRIAHRAAWQDGPDRLESTLYYMYRTLDNPVTTYIRETNNDTGLRLKYTHHSGADQWIAGLNFGYGTQDEARDANVNATRGVHILDRDLTAMNAEIYGQYEHPLAGRLFGIAGVQGAFDTRDITQTFPSHDRQTKTYHGISPRLGLRYDIDATTQTFLNVSRSFEPPTWSELSGGNAPGFHDLNAQTATTIEIGARGISWSAALYRAYLRDEFVNYKFADGSTDTINAAHTIHDGLELGWTGDIAAALALHANYMYSRFHLDSDPLYGDNQLPGMPRHYAHAEIMYRLPFGLSFGPNVEWASGYPVDLTNTVRAGAYAVYGARASWHSDGGRVETYIEGRNLLDRPYTATTNVVPDAGGVDGRYFYPGEGRSVYAGLRIKF